MFRKLLAAGALVALAACTDAQGYGGDPVKPLVAPPDLEKVHIEPDTVERSEVVRIDLKPPQALPATQVDAYKQKPGVVDILWLIDDSGSMHDQHTELAGNFQNFFNELVASQTDFRIATIATDQDLDAQLHGSVPIITRDTPDANSAFLDQVTYPNSRVAWVQGFAMLKLFLTTSRSASFLRPNAALAVIAVSDGDDDSFGGVPYYARWFREVKGQGNENLVTFSTISGDATLGCQPPQDEQYWGSRAEPSVRFTEMATRTGGVIGSICDTSFENTLTQIADALNTLRKIFPLSLTPDPATITVQVNGHVVPRDTQTGYTYVAAVNAIEFLGAYVPPPSADIQIDYAIAP